MSDFNETVTENGEMGFSAADFAGHFTDPISGNSLATVKITSLPAYGTLTWKGSQFATPYSVSVGAIDNLVYAPDANYDGADSFTWTAYDGTYWDGTVPASTSQFRRWASLRQ